MKSEPFLLEDVSYFTIPQWKMLNKDLVVGFTTKNDGSSSGQFQSLNVGLHVYDDKKTVVENRETVARKLSIPLSKWICAEQVHDNRIERVTSKQIGSGASNYQTSIPQTDGLYTNESNILLSLFFADCVPIFFFSPKHHMVGLVHAGWKGTVKNITGIFLKKWTKIEGILPNDIYVAIGPSIRACCYKVDCKVIKEVDKLFSTNSSKYYQQIEEEQYLLNLQKINKDICLLHGVPRENIVESLYCTSCQTNYFFSHRRDKGKTGRMMSFIGFKEVI